MVVVGTSETTDASSGASVGGVVVEFELQTEKGATIVNEKVLEGIDKIGRASCRERVC